jgi:hypothetical protein
MVFEDGGLQEAFRVFESMQEPLNFSKGILQAIGYKEFHALYKHFIESGKILNEESLSKMGIEIQDDQLSDDS